MTDFNRYNTNLFEETAKTAKPKKWRGVLATVSAGVIGSMLTMAILPYSDQIESLYSTVEQKVSNQTESSSNNSDQVMAQQTTATNLSDTSGSMADMVEEASKAIVGIVNKQAQDNYYPNTGSSETVESGNGTGVVFKIDDDSAYIVTNNHVIENATELEITVSGGEKTTAEVIGADVLTDLAVLKIDAKYAATKLDFGDSSTLRAGDSVLAIGNPLGLDFSNTVTQGIVSAVNRTVAVSTSAGEWDLNVIQTDAAINPGNSGGALINTSGQVIGINSLKISEDGVEGLGFAIPSNDLIPIINEIMEKGQVERPYIGIGLASLEEIPSMYLQNLPQTIEGGAMVTNIDSNSAAAQAGLKVQDIITSINDKTITSSDNLRKYLYSELEVGDTVSLGVYRGAEKMTIKLTLSSSNSIK
ncbi:trypsin-like peptidase domain-containing protein [Neobacillus sp. DY30]|uniref:S1C family serine protease n=1 Tax=Neobacillus sp. DY30 TaxID=3047871 RepID=UPI0024BFC241|nr:trypsin-like peptidase domain-containing protein [Neobacillus sp. DY30]WHY02765.1 trypsin-like peptidase domain-containing protein [Neobacillus sp. DY30]